VHLPQFITMRSIYCYCMYHGGAGSFVMKWTWVKRVWPILIRVILLVVILFQSKNDDNKLYNSEVHERVF